jgi:transposase-like protein
VGDIAEALAGEGISAATISRLNGRLSERLQEWRERPLSGTHRYLYLDGISLTVRWGGASERLSVLVAIGVTQEGFREVLACGAGFRESEESWRGLLRNLTERGLQGVRLVISDACAGLNAAVRDFPARRALAALHRARDEERARQGAPDEARGGGYGSGWIAS